MAIIFTEIAGSRSASITADQTTFLRQWDVLTTEDEGAAQVLLEGNYDLNSTIDGFPVTAIELTENPDSQDSWVYQVSYGISSQSGGGGGSESGNPLLEPAVISINYQQF
jgi:hypothetical protein